MGDIMGRLIGGRFSLMFFGCIGLFLLVFPAVALYAAFKWVKETFFR